MWLSGEAWINFEICYREKGEENIFEFLTISCKGGAGNTRDARGRLAGREGLALLFLAEEGRATHARHRLSWRVETGRPCTLYTSEAADDLTVVDGVGHRTI